MTGIGTLLADNPRLTVRDVETTRQPLRIVVDRHLEIPLDARSSRAATCWWRPPSEHAERALMLAQTGAEVLVLPESRGKVDLPR